jgi:enoyl-CoA hydratase
MSERMIDVERLGPVTIVALKRPPANAMNIEFLEEIAAIFGRLGQDSSVRSVVLTGHGKSFCAGVDLKAVPHYSEADQRQMLTALNRAFLAVYGFPAPVVGAINGHAIAGGLVLALCCDWRLVVNTPILAGLTEVRVGVGYPVSAIEIVRQELRPEVVRKLVLFAQNISGTAALEAGLFDEMIDPENLMQKAIAQAAEFAALPAAVFAKTKQQLRGEVSGMIEAAINGAEPLLNGWLSEQTMQAAAAVLKG